jgi:hypothetical protein
LRQQISHPPVQTEEQSDSAELRTQSPLSRKGLLALLAITGLVLLTFTGLFVKNTPELLHPSVDPAAMTATVVQQNALPVQLPGAATPAQLLLSGSHTIVYAQQNALYRVSVPNGTPQAIEAPGYRYNRAVPPISLANDQLLYSGNGLWITSISQGGAARQIASIADDQIITSLVLAPNGRDIAWSTAPANGKGTIRIYAGSLTSSMQVYQQEATKCPCFRVFSLTTPASGQLMLLLSNDYGDHHAVAYNLWSLTVSAGKRSEPQALLTDDPPQIPLTHAGNTVLYSTSNGIVPQPTDNSTPDDIAALSYANGLALSALEVTPSTALSPAQAVLPTQRASANFSAYHWVMSPNFAPDGQTLVYVLFSGDDQAPFARHSSLYTVHINGTGATMQVGKSQVLATASARYIEVGPWLNNDILTFYADNALYAMDAHTGATTLLTRLQAYGQIVAITG